MTIRRPQADDFAGSQAVATVNVLAEAARPLSDAVRGIGRMAYWSHLVPFAAMPALPLLHARWPEVFGTLEAYIAMIGLWAFGAWKLWLGPHYAAAARTRTADHTEFGEAAAMRGVLEAEWKREEQAR